MIREVTDLAVLNAFSARPDIAPHVGGALDFSGVDRANTVLLEGAFGCFLFERTGPNEYETHVMIASPGRGPWGFAAGMAARAEMARRGAVRLWARIDPDNRPLVAFTRRSGFRKCGTSPPLDIYEWRNLCPPQ